VSWAAVLILFGMSVFYPGWFIFGFLILMLGVRHPPPLNDLTRLDPARKLVGIVAVAILIVTFVPQPFAPVGAGRALIFEAASGSPLSEVNTTIVLGTSIYLMFAINNTGSVREDVVVNLRQNNLDRVGFVMHFTAYQIGTVTTPVNTDTVTFRLNASQRAILTLNLTAPPSWPAPTPANVTFQVHATTRDGVASRDLQVGLQVTS